MNLINFEGHIFEDLMPDLDKYIRENFNFQLCFYHKNSKKKEMECYCPTLDSYFVQSYEETEVGCLKGSCKPIYHCKHEHECVNSNCQFYNGKYPNINLKRVFDLGFFQKSDRGILLRVFRLTYRFCA